VERRFQVRNRTYTLHASGMSLKRRVCQSATRPCLRFVIPSRAADQPHVPPKKKDRKRSEKGDSRRFIACFQPIAG
jgi:hypothetical protein